jgi:SAM-dependent methyltransferase
MRTATEAAIWQDVEFGAYAADLPLWRRLAAASDGPVLELGAGSGRVALHLARNGAAVVAVERDDILASELTKRAVAADLPITAVATDVRELGELDFADAPGLALAPLHVIQQLDPADRPSVLAALRDLLAEGGGLAATVVDEASFLDEGIGGEAAPAPDMREVDGWVFSSEPLWVQVDADKLRIRRLRQRVSPDGDHERRVHDELLYRVTPEQLEQEAAAAGFQPGERLPIRSGPREADSIAVLMEAAP